MKTSCELKWNGIFFKLGKSQVLPENDWKEDIISENNRSSQTKQDLIKLLSAEGNKVSGLKMI